MADEPFGKAAAKNREANSNGRLGRIVSWVSIVIIMCLAIIILARL